MREAIMSIGALLSTDLADHAEETEAQRKIAVVRRRPRWDAEEFAKLQIRSLVRQVFFGDNQKPVQQVVISAIERETEVPSICCQVADALGRETSARVAVAGSSTSLQGLDLIPDAPNRSDTVPLQRFATRLSANVWRLPSPCAAGITNASLHSYLAQIRKQFDYSILELPVIGDSHHAHAMGEFADGIILIVSAQHTRRATARSAMESLAGTRARILGTVLSDIVFPIPEAIYRRL
jgi:hypothetical protein